MTATRHAECGALLPMPSLPCPGSIAVLCFLPLGKFGVSGLTSRNRRWRRQSHDVLLLGSDVQCMHAVGMRVEELLVGMPLPIPHLGSVACCLGTDPSQTQQSSAVLGKARHNHHAVRAGIRGNYPLLVSGHSCGSDRVDVALKQPGPWMSLLILSL